MRRGGKIGSRHAKLFPDYQMTLKQNMRRLVQKFGLDIVRYPLHDPLARTVRLLQHYRVDYVIDVGANNGGFASSIRNLGYRGKIISFEPLARPFEELRRKAAADGNWDVHQCAIGSTQGKVTINVSGNSGLSSSVLPMLDTHLIAAPNSRYVDIETVDQDRLDSLLPKLGLGTGDPTFLKVDVQGYEGAVLEGASGLFQDRAILGMQLELSLTPLYSGAMTYMEGLDRAEVLGMTLMGLDPVLVDPDSGRLLQADAVFFVE
jgi:FkbM family methyltransferase